MGKNSIALAIGCLIALAMTIIPQSQAQNSEKDFLNAHNKVRAHVGVGPLRWSKNMTNFARSQVEPRKGDCRLGYFQDGISYGYNVLANVKVDYTAAGAVKKWVDNKRYYNYKSNTCVKGQECMTYVQVVWRKTRDVGCVKVRCKHGGSVIGCAYYPPAVAAKRPY